MRAAAGIIAALIAGLAFNAGILIQKKAISELDRDKSIMRLLVKNKTWLSGFILQFVIGTLLYTVSVGLIGPAIVPGLMSIGLIALIWGAVHFYKEKIYIQDILGIVLLCSGVVCLGFSRLYIDVHSQDHFNQNFIIRFSIYCSVMIIIFLVLTKIQSPKQKSKTSGWNMASASAAAMNLVNLSLGVITCSLVKFTCGGLDLKLVILFSVNVLIVIAANIAGINSMQYALKRGRAVFVVPLQNIINKVFPVTIFFTVYRPYRPDAVSIIFLIFSFFCLVFSAVSLSAKYNMEKTVQDINGI